MGGYTGSTKELFRDLNILLTRGVSGKRPGQFLITKKKLVWGSWTSDAEKGGSGQIKVKIKTRQKNYESRGTLQGTCRA